MGADIRVETRTGDTPSDRKARQRARPPHILLTTPESLSLLLSYPDSFTMFAALLADTAPALRPAALAGACVAVGLMGAAALVFSRLLQSYGGEAS